MKPIEIGNGDGILWNCVRFVIIAGFGVCGMIPSKK
jgi:hypothetical protein